MNKAWINDKHVGVATNKQLSHRNQPLNLPPTVSKGKINLSSGKLNEPWVTKILQTKAQHGCSASSNEGMSVQLSHTNREV
jgi:hypothetical protein